MGSYFTCLLNKTPADSEKYILRAFNGVELREWIISVDEFLYATVGDFVANVIKQCVPLKLKIGSCSPFVFPASGSVAKTDPEKVLVNPWAAVRNGGISMRHVDTFMFQEIFLLIWPNAYILCTRA